MLRLLKKLRRSERGNVLILTAMAMPLLVGSAGLAVDTIQWTLWKRQLQRSADSAALAGVYQRIQVDTQAQVTSAVIRDLDLASNFTPPSLNKPAPYMALQSEPDVELLADVGTAQRQRVRVTLRVQRALSFSSMFMAQAPIIMARATAASVPGTDEYCFVSLENSASRSGITIGGNTKISMDCGMVSNSPASNSALSNGNSSTVTASVIAAVGGVERSRNWNVPKYDPYVPAVADPYANVNLDRAQMNCFSPGNRYPILGTSTSNNFNGNNATVTLTDARNTANFANTNCFRGLSVGSGQTMTLPAGTYYIGEAGMNVQGTLNCNGCTFVLTRIDTANAVGQLDVNAGGKMNITAPDSGTFDGIAIFQDRAATDVAQSNKINGSSDSVITGAVYFPRQEITYNGDGTTGFACTRLVGRRLVFTGNSGLVNTFGNDAQCAIFDSPIGGGRRVRLTA